MLAAKKQDGELCYAPEVEKTAAPFYCPGCQGNVTLKKGNKYIHHFAHVPQSDCDLRGESIEHMTAKWELYQGLKANPQVDRVEVEYTVEQKTRADVIFRKGSQIVVLEIQRSKLDAETIMRRMTHYTAHGIAVLWLVFPLKAKREWIDNETYYQYVTPQKWQRYIQRLYYGRLYEWSHGFGLETYQSHLTGSWHHRRSSISSGGSVNIVDDFKSQIRESYEDIPPLRIYLDTRPKWWH